MISGRAGGHGLKEHMQSCPQCGSGNPQNARFCNACGQRLEGLSALPLHRESVFGKLLRRVPKLRYVILAAILVGAGLAFKLLGSNNPDFERHVKSVTGQLQGSLQLLDIVNIAGTYWHAAEDKIWDCGDRCLWDNCLSTSALGGNLCYLLCTDNSAACLRCREMEKAKAQCVPKQICNRSCKGFNPLTAASAPFSAAFATMTILWSQLPWSGFVVAALAAALGALLIAGVLEHMTGSAPHPWFMFLLTPPVAFAITFLLKWILIGALIFFGYTLGLLIWIAGISGGLVIAALEVIATARRLQSVVEGEPASTESASREDKKSVQQLGS
jgi:zinc ribbon protein